MNGKQEPKEDAVAFKTPKQKDAEAMVERISQCEDEMQQVLMKWRMRLTVIEIHQDGRLVGLEIKATPAKSDKEIVGENGGD